jgi:8-oxo-dGTP pyrophosphatase MutT (NUDIX family)
MKTHKPHLGTLVLALDAFRLDPRRRLFLGLKPPETAVDKCRRRRKVGCDLWVPPGGGIEKIDKSPRHCAQRELFEEAGWRLPLNRFSKIGRLEGYFGSARSEWQTARLKWIVHIYSVTVPPELKDGFICGDGFVKVRWFPIDCLPFHRMIDSDKVWLPQLVGPHHLVIKLMFDRKVGKLIRSELIPEYFGERA